jgi:hypothetical protein
MSQEGFERFRELVWQDRALQQELWATTNQQEFIALVQRLGAERGCEFTTAEVSAALQASLRAWLERWLDG